MLDLNIICCCSKLFSDLQIVSQKEKFRFFSVQKVFESTVIAEVVLDR